MNTARIFNPRGRWLLRKRIPVREAWVGLIVLCVLALVVAWVAWQKDRYDASERDLSYEVLAAAPVRDTLYKRPLQVWVDPALPGAQADPTALLAPFPPGIAADGWRPGRVRHFGPDNLFEKINGEAEKFIKQGFQALHVLDMEAPTGSPDAGQRLAIELFDQGDFPGSLGIFSDHHGGTRRIQRQDGTLFFTTPAGAIGMRGRWFFRIAGSATTPALQARALAMVAALSALPGSQPPAVNGASPTPAASLSSKAAAPQTVTPKAPERPPGYRLLAGGLEIPTSRIAYKARNVFQFDFARDFWFGSPEGEGDLRLFVHLADDPGKAGELVLLMREELAYDYQPDSQGEGESEQGMVLLHQPVLKTWFALARRGRVVYGLERATSREGVASWMARLSQAVAAMEVR